MNAPNQNNPIEESAENIWALIKKLCPEGVEYRRLGDVATFTYGYTEKAKSSGTARFIRITDIDDNGLLKPADCKYIDLCPENEKYMLQKGDLVMARTGATYGKTLFYNENYPSIYASFLIKISLNNNLLLNRYYWHFAKSNMYWEQANKLVTTGGQPQFNANALCKISIPIPPLSVQREIVRILDAFTELTAELTEKLSEELTARKKQYAFYRDKMLGFERGEIEYKRLGDIATSIYRGAGIRKDEITPDGIPCVRYGEIHTTYKTWFDKCVSHTSANVVQNPKYFEHGDILFTITSENIEDVAKAVAYVGNETCLAGGDIVVLKHRQNPKYLAYALATENARRQITKGRVKSKVVHASVSDIENIVLPIPPLEIQRRIVDALDNFDAICSDLQIGLPAEIDARRKQYEYYRDLLLNFCESGGGSGSCAN